MSMVKRKRLFKVEEVDGNKELDLLLSKIPLMDLPTMAEYQITSFTESRLDLISKRFYNTFHLGWLIASYNDIFDPFNELYKGRVLNIPDLQEYFSFYNENAR